MPLAPRSLPVLLALTACAEDVADPEVAAACDGAVAVQLIATASPARELEVHAARGATMIALAEDRGESTHLGPACGAKAVRVLDGARVRPVPAGLDPADDDPRFACLGHDDLVELDLDGAAPPTRVLPHLACSSAIRTPHGVIFAESYTDTTRSGWWHFPDFPTEASAARITESWLTRVHGDTFYWLDAGLHAYDLATGATRTVVPDVFDFQVNDTHVLWVGIESSPPMVELLDLRTGAHMAVGEFTEADGSFLSEVNRGAPWSWNFDPTGKYVLHVPNDDEAPREAFDLRGERLSFPLPGRMMESLPGGHVLAYDEATLEVFAARPGDAAETRLDLPAEPTLGALRIRGDRIESVVADALYEVPLDGAPARLLAQDVGPARVWLGERHLLTIFADELVAIDIDTGAREVHRAQVSALALAPDGAAVYYTVAGAPGDPDNGVWYLPRTAL